GVDATGLSWTSDGSTRASGAGEGWTSVGDVGFMSTTFRTCGPEIRRYVVSGVSYGRARSETVAVRAYAGDAPRENRWPPRRTAAGLIESARACQALIADGAPVSSLKLFLGSVNVVGADGPVRYWGVSTELSVAARGSSRAEPTPARTTRAASSVRSYDAKLPDRARLVPSRPKSVQ